MKFLSLTIFRLWYRRAVVLPRPSIAHSEPSSFFSACPFLIPLSWGLTLGVLLLLPLPARADQTVYTASTQSNLLNNTNAGARSAAMGSAFAGVADDASALFSNPAGLGFLSQGQLFLNTDLWLVGSFQETALLGAPTPGLGGLGLAVGYLDYGTFDGRDELGSVTASYSADRLGFQAGWGYEILQDFSVGVGLNETQTSLAGIGYNAFSSNIGVLWKGPQGFGLGASYMNMGWSSSGGTSEAAVNLGVSYQAALDSSSRLLVGLGGSLEPDAVNYLQAGVECAIRGQMFLRAGCQAPLSDQSLQGLTDLTAGVGFHLSDFSLDYCFLPYGDLGAAHRVSIGYFFENEKPETSSMGNAASPDKGGSTGNPEAGPAGPQGVTIPGLGKPGSDEMPPKLHGPKSGAGTLVPSPPSGGSNSPNLTSSEEFPPLPSFNSAMPVSVQNPVSATGSTPSAAPSQPPTASPSAAKDSLVVQFDLPDNPTPEPSETGQETKDRQDFQSYSQAVAANPRDAVSWMALGKLYWRYHQKNYAVQCFQQVLQLEPNNQELANWLQRYQAANP